MLATMLSAAGSAFKYKTLRIRTPLVASISVTSRCNLRCVYCYSEEDNRRAADVPYKDLTLIIDDFYRLGTRIFMLQGGEPLLHPDIDSIIAYVKAKKAYCSVTTNAVHFRKHLDALKTVDQVQISIDGNREITEENRGKGVYEAILEAVKLCHQHRIPFHLHTVLTKAATVQNTLEPLTGLAQEYKTYLNFCIPAPTGSARDRHLATNAQVHELYLEILNLKGNGMPTNNSDQGLRDVIDWTSRHTYDSYIRSDDRDGVSRHPKCIMGDLVCWLDARGMLHPCAIHFGQEGFSQSIGEHGVEGAWELLRKRPCHYCAGSTEFNNLLRFNPASVVNGLKFIFKRS